MDGPVRVKENGTTLEVYLEYRDERSFLEELRKKDPLEKLADIMVHEVVKARLSKYDEIVINAPREIADYAAGRMRKEMKNSRKRTRTDYLEKKAGMYTMAVGSGLVTLDGVHFTSEAIQSWYELLVWDEVYLRLLERCGCGCTIDLLGKPAIRAYMYKSINGAVLAFAVAAGLGIFSRYISKKAEEYLKDFEFSNFKGKISVRYTDPVNAE